MKLQNRHNYNLYADIILIEHYLSLAPQGKGCPPEDAARAIIYAIEQENETGQAIPVTGGQIMVK